MSNPLSYDAWLEKWEDFIPEDADLGYAYDRYVSSFEEQLWD